MMNHSDYNFRKIIERIESWGETNEI
jgi:hypothetical protein